jgi:general secretion pathway protein F
VPVFEYKALDAQGKEVKGIVDADTAAAARIKLRSQGIYPTYTSAADEKKTAIARKRLVRISPRDLALPMRQLATLLGSGLPLVESLSALIEQTEKPSLRKIFSQIREEVLRGKSLSAAMGEHPRVFSNLQVNMIRAGESSGGLEIVLDRQAELMEKRLELSQRVRSTLMYPIFMAVIGTSVLIFLMSFVVPTVTTIFKETGQALPLPTKLLISFGSALQKTWWVFGLIGMAMLFFWIRFTRTERGRKVKDRAMLKIPLWGVLQVKFIIARFFRTLGTLLLSGVPLLPSMDISGAVAGNAIFEEAIKSMKNQVAEGKSLALPLKNAGIFPPMAVHMVQSGEKSGKLEPMLLRVAETYEKEAANSINGFTSLLEPIMILCMGLIVGFIVLAILLPILEMSQVVR